MNFHPLYKFPFGRVEIHKDLKYFIKNYSHPKLNYIALFIHECVHYFDWVFICRFNVKIWN